MEVVSAFKKRQSELSLPTTVRVSYGGETEDINRSFTEMLIAIADGLTLMLAILAFNSARYSLYSLIGVFAGLTMLGLLLSFT